MSEDEILHLFISVTVAAFVAFVVHLLINNERKY